MLNHRAIMRDAWTRCRKAHALSAASGFLAGSPAIPHRILFAKCLWTAWRSSRAARPA